MASLPGAVDVTALVAARLNLCQRPGTRQTSHVRHQDLPKAKAAGASGHLCCTGCLSMPNLRPETSLGRGDVSNFTLFMVL